MRERKSDLFRGGLIVLRPAKQCAPDVGRVVWPPPPRRRDRFVKVGVIGTISRLDVAVAVAPAARWAPSVVAWFAVLHSYFRVGLVAGETMDDG